MSLKIIQLHKRASYEYKNIQDKYSYSEIAKCYAIADGTTQSLQSELWAELITNDFIKRPFFDPTVLISALINSAKKFKELPFDFSANPAKASLEKEKLKRGATATFIGVKYDVNNKLHIISSGDSNVFILRKNILLSFPFKNVEDLDSNKYFLNTEKLLSDETDNSFFWKDTISIEDGDLIILATDALSRLLLKDLDSHNDLLLVHDFDSLLSFCLKYWERKEMEEDDITALIIYDFKSNSIKKILPTIGFSFPKEEEVEFFPTSKIQAPINQLNEYEMEQLSFNLNRIYEELKKIKKKSRINEMLLMVAIILIAINISLMFYLKPEQHPKNAIIKNTTKAIPENHTSSTKVEPLSKDTTKKK